MKNQYIKEIIKILKNKDSDFVGKVYSFIMGMLSVEENKA